MRLFAFVLLALLSVAAFAPTGVPLDEFSHANPAKVPSALMSAAKSEQLSFFAARLAVDTYVEDRGPLLQQPEMILTLLRGRAFSGEGKMIAYALENARIAGDIQGWQAAVDVCFRSTVRELTLAEAAVVVIHMRSPSTNWSARTDALLKQRNRLLEQIAKDGYATEIDAVTAKKSPLRFCQT